ncbi:MAG: Glu/Leu/Phe/Val dehydrogenase [Deltaproteobacteria bacterium]|nr:Glu/Leu/Phe/Val dehydrogenase [Deltaproteobacteria bacterium]MBW1929817.1 Glu/Leu/Phe/Val dehydrogenase [Deltaproteobacteria bacterium]MBW2024138.1 Glu/Leu/Phe/Val dehydrogenase [Deltaproteobacteria bacterium]MBW2126051.1 Glu/Leu/Phe/Val dehydrogenase [Deltaproteobacteria bacterium]RLB24396.1 MAG: leucine dehydrogenase [Deltaproteobacteria bacterium]
MESIFEYMENYDYENLFLCQDKDLNFKAIIAIHDTTLGPATGGCRMWQYESEMDAIEDALRLARGMTYKYAAAGVNLGGGKAVIIGDPGRKDREPIFRLLGKFIDRLGGLYITGEDVGTTLKDMEYIRMETRHVVTLPSYLGGAGDIAPMTAFGVIRAMQACCKRVYGQDSLEGKVVAVQGLGAVGHNIVGQLHDLGAKLIVSDIDPKKVENMTARYGVESISPENIYDVDCDIFCPCALGGILNDNTLDRLKCKIVCGAANNQLKEERHGELIEEKGMVYAPDYIANAGGTIFDTDRLESGNVNNERGKEKVSRIYENMEKVFEIADRDNIPTYLAADRVAEERIRQVAQVKRYRVDPRL